MLKSPLLCTCTSFTHCVGRNVHFTMLPSRAGAYQDDQIYAKVDDMTYYPVNNMLVSLPTNTNSTNVSSPALPPTASLPQPPPPPVINSKTLHHHQGSGGGCTGGGGTSGVGSRPADFGSAFGTVHRSQKIYL